MEKTGEMKIGLKVVPLSACNGGSGDHFFENGH